MKNEPAVIIGIISSIIASIFAVLVAFGLRLTDDQQTALLGLTASLAPLVVAVITRAKVYAPSTVEAKVAEASEAGWRAAEENMLEQPQRAMPARALPRRAAENPYGDQPGIRPDGSEYWPARE